TRGGTRLLSHGVSFLVIPGLVVPCTAPARAFARAASRLNCRWLKTLSDKKGYHGSLPVPSATLHACCVQYCAPRHSRLGRRRLKKRTSAPGEKFKFGMLRWQQPPGRPFDEGADN